MGLHPEELHQHCRYILNQRRIKNKIVVLCEGSINVGDTRGRLSPQSYSRMEKMPDANFYHACVPKHWKQYRPQFFNCAARKDVIDTYFTLLELHNKNPTQSYLNPDKLFAIIDLDIQIQNIKSYYNFANTEEIFTNLYYKAEVNVNNVEKHYIWVTGLLHKEAYFLTPELQPIFDIYLNTPIYDSEQLSLEKVYLKMADNITDDVGLRDNLARASNRINHCTGLDCSSVQELCNSWKNQYHSSTVDNDSSRQNELIYSLLTLTKAKEQWQQIQPPDDSSISPENFREQLLLEIGKFYAENSSNPKYHISFFLEILSKLIY